MNNVNNENSSHNQDNPIKDHHLSTGSMITGILLVLLGIIFLLAQLFDNWFISDYWPFFLIAGGLIFYGAYFTRTQKPAGYEGMLFPGTYLVLLGLLFLLANIIGWYSMRYLWPTFVLAVALSLGAMYLFGPKEPESKRKDLYSGIKVLFIISVVLYLIAAGGLYLWPLALIIIGLWIIIKGLTKR